MRRAQQQAFAFPAYDSASLTGALKSGLTLLASDVQISKDGGAFAPATNAPAELGSTGVYALTLTKDEANCGYVLILIRKAGMRDQVEGGALDGQPAAAVVSGSATTFVTNLAEAVDDFWKGAGVVFTSGALKGQVREIASYAGASKAITLDVALTAAPAAGDAFVIINS